MTGNDVMLVRQNTSRHTHCTETGAHMCANADTHMWDECFMVEAERNNELW